MTEQIVHIDGGTAVGKDTVATLIKPRLDSATGLDWKIRTGSLSESNPYLNLARNLNKKGITHPALFTTLALLSLAHDVKNADTSSPTILAGFNALRSAAHHESNDTKVKGLFMKLLRDASPLIGHSFVLEASLEERVRRLAGRPEQQTKADRLLLEKPDEVLRTDGHLLRLGIKYLSSEQIETTNLRPDGVADKLVARYLERISTDI